MIRSNVSRNYYIFVDREGFPVGLPTTYDSETELSAAWESPPRGGYALAAGSKAFLMNRFDTLHEQDFEE